MMNIIYIVGVVDAAAVTIAGLVAASLQILGKDSEIFWNRVAPATGTLVGTSIAAGVIMLGAKWFGA